MVDYTIIDESSINPVVSIAMLTYNHQDYIGEAIESVLMQQTSYSYKIIIAEDYSTDKTREIILEYQRKNPAKIKLILQDVNVGASKNNVTLLSNLEGKYIAALEGDDYWTDPLKLQKQVDFLEANPDYVLCFHPVNILKTDGSIVDDFITKVPENYETIETLARFRNYIHTPTVVFRNIMKEFPFEFQLSPFGDYFLYMMLAEHGKLKCLQDKMAIYRYNVGVVSRMSGMDIANNNLKMYSCLISYFKNESIKRILFDKQINVVTSNYSLAILDYEKKFKSEHNIIFGFITILKLLKKPKKLWLTIKLKFSKLM